MEAQKQKKVIVWALNDFLVGGAQRLAIDIIRELGTETYEWHIMTFFEFPERSTMYDQLPDFVTVHRYAFAGARDFRSWMRVWRDMRTIRPQAVLSNTFFSNFVTRILKLVLGYRISIVEHNTHRYKSRFHIFLDQFLAMFTFKIVAVSEEVLRFTSWQEDITEKKFLLIRNGVDLAKARTIDRNNREHIILNVARIVEQKNHKLLVESFVEFVRDQEFSDYRLVLLGEGKLADAIKQQAKGLGVADRVELVGFKDPYPYYAQSTVFVSTSFVEGMSVAYIEALACGLPVVATETAGTAELIVDGESGRVLPQGSTPIEIAEAIKTTIGHITTMSVAAQKAGEAFSIETCAQGYARLFADMLKR